MTIRRRYRFHGRVQGVGFRATAQAIADRLGVAGWVRNEPDGTVLLEAQATPENLDALLARLHAELPGYISGIDANDIPPADPADRSFDIHPTPGLGARA